MRFTRSAFTTMAQPQAVVDLDRTVHGPFRINRIGLVEDFRAGARIGEASEATCSITARRRPGSDARRAQMTRGQGHRVQRLPARPAPPLRVLTGITTSGMPHLGNYAGAIRPAI